MAAEIQRPEEVGLVVPVLFPGAVEFEMLVRHVRHDAYVEGDVPQPVGARGQSVRTRLYDGVLHAVIAHRGEGRMDRRSFRGRLMLRIPFLRISGTILDGGDETRAFSDEVEELVNEEDGGAFPLGPRHADHGEVSGREAPIRVGEGGHRPPRIADADVRDALAATIDRSLVHDRDGAPIDGGVDERMAVDVEARQGEIGVAPLNTAGIVGEAGDHRIEGFMIGRENFDYACPACEVGRHDF